ncbi:MAG TPA: electron transfer flavoprotein subunit alpha/FixB family protein [Vicinamibacteria bacterium]|nr:electron transfer flavoprotein subunit alpha/FixB family protein [Vicinamibacteria bacterium]
METKIVVLAEHDGKVSREISLELLGLARRINEGGEVKALLLGNGIESVAEELASRGAAEVIYVEGEAVENYNVDAYRKSIEPILNDETPDLVLIGHTPNGWDVAAPLAARLGVPLVTGCAQVTMSEGRALLTRKAFNGKFVHQVEVTGARPLMATVDKGASAPFEGKSSGTVRKIESPLSIEELRASYIETRTGESGGLDLREADVIVSAGRGVGGPDKLGVVRELAEALGGQLGASRAVTDAGWLPHEHQIGSSGVSVSPKLYVACGISGAIQHVVGMKGSGYIVAINKDPDAPIFGVAHVGVVGDLFEIAPALTKALREAKGK